jgi:hypothetical protein
MCWEMNDPGVDLVSTLIQEPSAWAKGIGYQQKIEHLTFSPDDSLGVGRTS